MNKILTGLSVLLLLVTAVDMNSAAASEEKALQLARLAASKETYQEMVRQVMEGLAHGNPQATPELREKLIAVLYEALPYEEMLQINAKIYGKRFSDAELDDITNFYKTPTGAKLIRELPGITGDVSKEVGTLMPQRLPSLLKKHGITK